MVLLALQFGGQPHLQAHFIDSSLNATTVVLLVEIFKLMFAVLFMMLEGSIIECIKSWRPLSSLAVAALPAATYAAQNVCIQTAYRNLDPLVFNLVNQTKLLWTAVLTYFLLGRGQSSVQILALSMLFISAVLISIGEQTGLNDEYDEKNLTLGMLAVISASFLSGVGAAITELALRSYHRNSYLLSGELAMYSAILIIVVESIAHGEVPMLRPNFVAGISLLPIFTQAIGGIVVGQVTKHAGSVHKGFSIIGGIIITAILRSVLVNAPLRTEVCMAMPVTLLATYMYAKYPPAQKLKLKEK
ncbi:nucleotide-sugar transporter, putative [Perkinsus marinus ATCC 50983]|uniref:Nucleotide-sugar transporter, putative n=1 Tax=Perkinsus marinus (strain ATCC 50983 / TXsc) TaxID=423536 RepID=C5KN34_PERM5|nr:nucleotide-sugar transporter, putative [Perkinsus marinus ATCC 50983]EER14068.1 nucleotide-sugar transporter, putative [Perkinsus marinus ATCC 50983]|eukprot:XP_002782273.1 nucleotide-sugar transporter, putative [Perkinsus marinus ATCC 50983]